MSSSKPVWAVALLAVCIVTATAGPSYGGSIPITNASFEDPVLAEDGWTWGDVPGWTSVGANEAGVWNTTLSDFDPVVAPDGQNVLYFEVAPTGTPRGRAQVLNDTFATDTDYTLSVEVGNSWNYYWSGYKVQLLAGGTVIAEDNDTVWPDYMLWDTSTVEYTYDPGDSGLEGLPLEIRLFSLALDKDAAAPSVVGVEFDDVKLDAVPEPSTFVLLGMGALGLLLYSRRKRA